MFSNLDKQIETWISVLHFTQNHRSTKDFLYLNYTVMNRSILFLPQHHQGNDDDSCYDNPSNHKSDNGAFIGPHILSEKHLPLKENNPKLFVCTKHRPLQDLNKWHDGVCSVDWFFIPVFHGKLHSQHFASLQSPFALLASPLAAWQTLIQEETCIKYF